MTDFVKFEGLDASPELARRLTWAFLYIRSRGGSIKANEIRRILGIPSDQNVRNASQTSTGGSNQWYQWGRFLRGETPSAAYPGGGDHPAGNAADTDTNNMALRAEAYRLAGIENTIPSESWHGALRGQPLVNVDDLASATPSGQAPANTASPNKDNTMKLLNVTGWENGTASKKVLIEDGRPDRPLANDGIAQILGVYYTDQDTTKLKSITYGEYAAIKAVRGA